MDALLTTLVTEHADAIERGGPFAHHLPVEQTAALSASGRAQAVCGRVFLPAALSAPLGAPCPLCRAVLDLATRPDVVGARGR